MSLNGLVPRTLLIKITQKLLSRKECESPRDFHVSLGFVLLRLDFISTLSSSLRFKPLETYFLRIPPLNFLAMLVQSICIEGVFLTMLLYKILLQFALNITVDMDSFQPNSNQSNRKERPIKDALALVYVCTLSKPRFSNSNPHF
ncbi:hypothetical protein PSTEL_06600 [Paenibacillus stellifer]|uniref:Uncharacterized protein n=1 Tax=Paenibacillus stellifer TaxID=169760 RepID=A0A089LPN3_9BACL|nr:hypothetical protein PSTEL_06600 [Paenibacillus stellifer]